MLETKHRQFAMNINFFRVAILTFVSSIVVIIAFSIAKFVFVKYISWEGEFAKIIIEATFIIPVQLFLYLIITKTALITFISGPLEKIDVNKQSKSTQLFIPLCIGSLLSFFIAVALIIYEIKILDSGIFKGGGDLQSLGIYLLFQVIITRYIIRGAFYARLSEVGDSGGGENSDENSSDSITTK